MRDICLVVEGVYPRVTGGVSQWVQDLVEGLPSLSFSVLSLVPEDADPLPAAYAPPANVEVVEVPLELGRGADAATRAIAAAAPDATVYHAALTGFAGAVATRAATARDRASLVTEHGVAWWESDHGWRGDSHRLPHVNDRSREDRRAWADLHRRLAQEAYAAAASVTGVSPWTVRLQRSLGADSILLQNGVAPAASVAPAAAVPPAAGPRIGFVGRVAPVKDVLTFLRAGRLVADEVPGAELVVLGPLHHYPLYAERCVDEARRLGIADRVRFVGEADPAAWYPTFDALVLTSVSEAQPLVALEAMAHGVPVVATAVGGCIELVGGAGLLTPASDPRATARAVVRLLSDPALHAQAARAGRERVAASHRLDRMVDGYESLYHRAAGRSTRA